jgi:hypothetical protein
VIAGPRRGKISQLTYKHANVTLPVIQYKKMVNVFVRQIVAPPYLVCVPGCGVCGEPRLHTWFVFQDVESVESRWDPNAPGAAVYCLHRVTSIFPFLGQYTADVSDGYGPH